VTAANEHHDRAMELADQADALRRSGLGTRSMQLYQRALAEEEVAVRLSIQGGAGVKTLSVLHRSAASLAMDCQDWTKARFFIESALRIPPPDSVEQELKDLLKKLPPFEESAVTFKIIRTEGENTLQPDVQIKGSLRVDTDLIFNGTLEGEIIAGGELTLGKSADVHGEIRAGSVNLFGKVQGNVFVDDICKIFSSAMLIGNLRATRLVFEEGASFVGLSEVIPSRARVAQVKNERGLSSLQLTHS
jgi:cytoskeletal protein CcmA (bactofilin family)